MRSIASAASLLVGMFSACAAFAAEPLVIDLWPGKMPGDAGIAGEEKSFEYQSEILGGPTKLVTNVSQPTLTVYRADQAKAPATAMLICPGGG